MISLRSLCVFLPLFFAHSAFAVITVLSASGGSNFINSTTNPAIYGSSLPICAGATVLTACNPAAPINSNSLLTITFQSNVANTGIATIVGPGSTIITPSTATQINTKGQTATLSVTWGQLCGSITSGDATCATMAPSQFRVGINSSGTSGTFGSGDDSIPITIGIATNTNNTVIDCTTAAGAICNFWAYPADEGVYLTDLSLAGGFPTTSTGNVVAIQVMISKTGWDKANYQDADMKPVLTLDAAGNYDEFISGLENDPATPYYFRIASVDVAGNIFNYTDDANIIDPRFGNCVAATAGPPYVDADPLGDKCRYRAFPDRVLGILGKDINCFVATAAYGSSLEPKIQTFRDFRFHYLLPNMYGKKFVVAYYKFGPIAAHWIAERDWARFAARTLLWPAWAFAALSLKLGLQKAILATLMLLVFGATALAGLTSWARKPRYVSQT